MLKFVLKFANIEFLGHNPTFQMLPSCSKPDQSNQKH